MNVLQSYNGKVFILRILSNAGDLALVSYWDTKHTQRHIRRLKKSAKNNIRN